MFIPVLEARFGESVVTFDGKKKALQLGNFAESNAPHYMPGRCGFLYKWNLQLRCEHSLS